MKAILSDILDYSIESYTVSIGNSNDTSTYIIPYDGAEIEEILNIVPRIALEPDATNPDGSIDELYFTLSCRYSHIAPDRNLTAKYELRLEDTLLVTEYAPILSTARPKPNSLLRAAKKCARKIISQERAALKYGMLKTIHTNTRTDN